MHTIYRQGLVPRHACTCHGTNDRLPLTSCRLSTAWQSIWFIIYVHEHDFETMIISPCHDAIDVLLQTKYMACTAMVLYQSNRIVETNQQKRCPHSRSRPEPKRDKVWLQQDRFVLLSGQKICKHIIARIWLLAEDRFHVLASPVATRPAARRKKKAIRVRFRLSAPKP